MAHPALVPGAIASTLWSTAVGVAWLLLADGRRGLLAGCLWAAGQAIVLVAATSRWRRRLGPDFAAALVAAWLGLAGAIAAVGVMTHARWQAVALASLDAADLDAAARASLRTAALQRSSLGAYVGSMIAPRAWIPAVFALPIACLVALGVDARRRG
jgi:hypothetical protein